VIIDVEVISVEGGDAIHRARTPLLSRPHIVGYQCAGRISRIGERVTTRAVGDRVVTIVSAGAYAERVAAPATTTWRVPEGADVKAIACVPVAFGTAHEALFALGGLVAGQRVLVHAGGGGVGLAAIQLARAAGAEVLATASRDDKLARLRELGVKHAINYATGSFAGGVTRAVGSNAIDLVVDPVGGKVLQDSAMCLRYRGRIVNLGLAGRDATPFNARPLWGQNATLIGMSLMTSLQNEFDRVSAVIDECIARVASGELRVIVDKTFSLADAHLAHEHVESRTTFGRVVMVP
jgi:NADPH2:quinone reductase